MTDHQTTHVATPNGAGSAKIQARLRATLAAAASQSATDPYGANIAVSLLRDAALLVLATPMLAETLTAEDQADLELLGAFAARPELVTHRRLERLHDWIEACREIVGSVTSGTPQVEEAPVPTQPRPAEPSEDYRSLELYKVLETPSVIDNSLERLGVYTVGDLIDLTLERARETPGIGRTKIRILRDLKARVELQFGGAIVEESKPQLRDQLEAAGVPPATPTLQLMRTATTRMRNVIARGGLEEIGALADAFEARTLRQIEGAGPGVVREVQQAIEGLLTLGPDRFVYGEQGRPEDLGALTDWLLTAIDDDDQRLLRDRIEHGRTLEELGSERNVSRERARQRESKSFDTMQALGRTEVQEMLADEVARLGAHGIIELGAFEALGARDRLSVLLPLRVADVDANIWRDRYVTTWPATEAESRVRALRHSLAGSGMAVLDAEAAIGIARREGWQLDDVDLLYLFETALQLERDDHGDFRVAQSLAQEIVAVVRRAGGPVGTQDICAAIGELRGEEPPPSHSVRRTMFRAPEIYTIGNGVYVHRDHVDVDEEQLDELAEWAISRLIGATDLISCGYLLDEADNDGIDVTGVTPYLLRDMLSREEGVTTVRNTLHVAWEPTFKGEDLTLEDRVTDILRVARRPLSPSDVQRRFPPHLRFHEVSVNAALEAAPNVEHMARGLWVYREPAQPDATATFELDEVPPECRRILSELLAEPLVPIDELRVSLREFRAGLHARPVASRLLDPTFVEGLCDMAAAMLDRVEAHGSPRTRRLAQAGVRYLLLADDADPDLAGVYGFDDDEMVLIAVDAQIKRLHQGQSA